MQNLHADRPLADADRGNKMQAPRERERLNRKAAPVRLLTQQDSRRL